MHSTNNDVKDDINDDNNPCKRRTDTPPTIASSSQSSQSSSPSPSTLLVIDDTSDSEEVMINNNNNTPTKCANHIPIKSIPANITAQLSNMQIPVAPVSFTHDLPNDTVDQKRRRNSSIAKLLGGRPLHNQQYEEIHQQILESQSAHNAHNIYDTATDSDMQRSRSSITRTLLMNTEQANSLTKVTIPLGPSFSKDFEYLIRHELDKVDNEHGPITVQRNHSAPMAEQNLKSLSDANAQSKLKRKRSVAKPLLSTPNVPPFSLHNSSETESATNNPIPSKDHPPNQFLHLDSTKRPRYLHQQQQPSVPVNNSSYLYYKSAMNFPLYNQFNVPQDHTPSNMYSSSYGYAHYSSSPVTHLTSSSSSSARDIPPMTSTRKTKSMPIRSDPYERSRQRSYSSTSNQFDLPSEASSKTTIPLKKRLLDAYNNEHHPNSSL